MTAADMSAREVLTDVELLNKKNKEGKRLKLQIAVQWIIIVLLALAIAAIALVSRFNAAQPQPNIDVLKRETFGNDDSSIRIPASYEPGQERPTITAGVPFKYNTRGEKLESVAGNIAYQLNCEVDGAPSRIPLGEVFSMVPKGKFNTDVTYTIPISSRIVSSEACRLQTIVTYTFYQTDNAGNTRAIEVPEIGLSNYFRLDVPEDETAITTTTNNIIAQQPVSTQPAAKPETVSPTEPITDPPETTTIPESPAPETRPTGLIPGLIYDLTRHPILPLL